MTDRHGTPRVTPPAGGDFGFAFSYAYAWRFS
jgi:hypothetical protein